MRCMAGGFSRGLGQPRKWECEVVDFGECRYLRCLREERMSRREGGEVEDSAEEEGAICVIWDMLGP